MHHALRQFSKSPGFSLLAVLTLALGIGATTTIFSVVNGVLLNPLPFPRSDRLYSVWETNPSLGIEQFSASVPNFTDWRERSQSWSGLAATTARSANLTGAGEPAHLLVQYCSADFWEITGYQPLLGRTFRPDEDQPGRNGALILTQRAWERHFGASPNILGRSVRLNDQVCEIVGVAPAGFTMDPAVDAFAPLGADLAREGRDNHEIAVIGRLREGVTPGQAEAELHIIAGQLAREYPESNTGWSTRLDPFANWLVNPSVRLALWVLLGGVGLVLFIACANVSNLLLVRATARTRELAIRTALGGGRGRLVRLLLAESLALAIPGAALGLLVATWAVDALQLIDPAHLPRAEQIAIDGRVAAFAALLALVSGGLAGLAPLAGAVRLDVQEALKARSQALTSARSPLRDALVVVQIALSLVLLIGGALLARSFERLTQQDLGFDAANVLTFRLSPTESDPALYDRLLPRLAALPGVEHIAVTSTPPFSFNNTSLDLTPIGPSRLGPDEKLQADWRMVSGDYFQTLRVPLLAGRTFTPADNPQAPRVILVNQTLARQLWGEEDPVGKRVRVGSGTQETTVVGVVADFRHRTPDQAVSPAFFLSAHRVVWGSMTVVVRTQLPSEQLVPSLRGVIRELEPTLPLHGVRMLSDLARDSVARQRLQTTLFAALAAIAGALSLVGLYSVIAFSVAQRTREIGVRVALGAHPRHIVKLIGRHGARLIACGLALGLLAAFAAARLMESLLFEISATDPWAFCSVPVALSAVALAASLLPTRRALRVSPTEALRAE